MRSIATSDGWSGRLEISDSSISPAATTNNLPLVASLLAPLFASLIADTLLSNFRGGDMLFTDVAEQMSDCELTKDKGGEVGWVDFATASDGEHHLDGLLPRNVRESLVPSSGSEAKTGDILKVSSERGVHLIQLCDIMVDVRERGKKRGEGGTRE